MDHHTTDDFDKKSLRDRGTTAGAFCRRKGYSANAAKSMLAAQATFLATDMQHLTFETRTEMLKVYAEAFLAAFQAR